jgi:hypothetical protein
MSCNLTFLISHPPAVVLAAMSETQNATFHSPASTGNVEEPQFLLRGESPTNVLGFGQRLVAITHKMPELELLQDSAQDSDFNVDGAVSDAF